MGKRNCHESRDANPQESRTQKIAVQVCCDFVFGNGADDRGKWLNYGVSYRLEPPRRGIFLVCYTDYNWFWRLRSHSKPKDQEVNR